MLREVMERWSIHPLALGYSFHFWVFGPYSITLGIWAISGLGNIVNNAANLLAGVFCEALYAFLLGVYLDTWIEGVLGFSRVCPSLSIPQASWFHHSEITTALTEKFFKEASNQGFETWNSTFYGEESNFLDSRSGKNRVGTVFPGRRIWCWWTCKGTAAPEELCIERVFERGSVLPLSYSAHCCLGRSKVTSFRNLYMPWILHPWQHMLYIPFYFKQWEIKHLTWSNVRFQVGGWKKGKAVSPSGNLSDKMPNAKHLRTDVDRKTPCFVSCIKKCLSLPGSLSLTCPGMLIASQNISRIHTHTLSNSNSQMKQKN